MEVVILGLKNKTTGEYRVYFPKYYSRHADELKTKKDINNRHSSINTHRFTKVPILSPFPYETFSSLSFENQSNTLRMYDPCYLLVEAELTTSEFENMDTSGIMYHRFENRNIKLIREFEKPFQYALNLVNSKINKLPTYDLTTWLIHETAKSPEEHAAMVQILKIAIKKINNKYTDSLDLSLDEYVFRYLPDLIKIPNYKNCITFGRYGSNDISPKLLKGATISKEVWEFIYPYLNEKQSAAIINNNVFTYEFYLELKNNLDNQMPFNTFMYSLNDYKLIIRSTLHKISINKLLPDYINIITKNLQNYFETDVTNKSLKDLFTEPYEPIVIADMNDMDDPFDDFFMTMNLMRMTMNLILKLIWMILMMTMKTKHMTSALN